MNEVDNIQKINDTAASPETEAKTTRLTNPTDTPATGGPVYHGLDVSQHMPAQRAARQKEQKRLFARKAYQKKKENRAAGH